MQVPPGALLVMALLALVASCTKARGVVLGAPRCVSWKQEIGPLFAGRCQTCHAGPTPAARYDTSSYAGVLGGGSDAAPNATAGDAGSRLLTALDPAIADATHRPVSDVFPTVRGWVVDCDLSYVRSSVHRGGILDPASADFHGTLLREEKYAFGVCQQCHGIDFAGGTSGVSCLSCHTKGPTDCSTCHGALATSGSHGHHLGAGPQGETFACAECHLVPKVYTDVGHIFLADGTLDPPPAEVKLGALAALTPPGARRAAPPAFDAATQACSNVYCHGALLGDSASTNTQPVWKAAGTGQADCGTCHGLPPNHVGTATACSGCHPSVVDKDRKIIAPDKHVDGKIDFADPAAGCAGCHGTAVSAAPPPALGGETARSAPGVGAHEAHVTGAAHLRGPVACNECHLVPTDVTSAGHFAGHVAGADPTDGAEVFPARAGVGVLASTAGAAPHWDRATATCSSVYCHGGGMPLAVDTTVGVDHAPVWTAAGGLVCGSACHGLPPAFSPHLPTMTRTDCASCHPRTVDPTGVIIIAGPPGAETSAHINGVLDVAP
jgi:predicted CxxxxCH...CXXCH cytochrome family protein